MPNLSKIVCLINQSIQTDAFTGQPFQSAKFHTIARPRENTDQNGWTMPMVVSDEDNGTFVNPDDTFPLVVYHTVGNPEYLDDQKVDFGDPGTWMVVKYPLQLICFGDRLKIQTEQENIIDSVSYNFPKTFTNSQLQPLGITDCNIDMDSTNNDSLSVWNQEFKDVDFPLKNNQFIFSIKYTVKMTYKCFSLC